MTQLYEALKDSCYTAKAASVHFGVNYSTLMKWMHGHAAPNKDNQPKMEKIMHQLSQEKRIQRHPSYGYATPEQIRKLETLGMGPERQRVMDQIAHQTASQGKTVR